MDSLRILLHRKDPTTRDGAILFCPPASQRWLTSTSPSRRATRSPSACRHRIGWRTQTEAGRGGLCGDRKEIVHWRDGGSVPAQSELRAWVRPSDRNRAGWRCEHLQTPYKLHPDANSILGAQAERGRSILGELVAGDIDAAQATSPAAPGQSKELCWKERGSSLPPPRKGPLLV